MIRVADALNRMLDVAPIDATVHCPQGTRHSIRKRVRRHGGILRGRNADLGHETQHFQRVRFMFKVPLTGPERPTLPKGE